ncbi:MULTISPECIES: murein transglycosylase [unclassified Photorhabdus]|uniref:murein transglycosylase n=1 Tax=unclassified Photorhabdus TaxID=2620880 RepID=UPI000DCBD395|nr:MULTISPECIES: murein transglycosylase [unclassified Photorhabdus]RAX01330.1 murein transglycosylase [Photorhabdus sp. S10-54]RAX02156.1 murein transglycosylase [Photorhabdus sp. S9-53]RAX04887.1 murein transglycosylase [Photorhabdus sp. S8-52]
MAKWQYLAMAIGLIFISVAANADSLENQRQRYQQIKQAWNVSDRDEIARLMPTLKDYPLYPYLEYRELTQDLALVTPTQIRDFIDRYPNLPPARSLPSRFINELARREEWRGILAFTPTAPKSITARCHYYFAKWSTGEEQVAWQGAKEIWLNGRSLPASCDKLFDVWQQTGHLSVKLILQRISLALKAGNTSLVSYLAKQLPLGYKSISEDLIKLQNDPATVADFANHTGPTDFTRVATLAAFSRFARQDPEQARAIIPSIVRVQKMNASERQRLKDIVAWQLMGDVSDEQEKWRDDAIRGSQSVALLERRVRLALGHADKRGLAQWIKLLPLEDQGKEEWRYWRANILLAQGNKSEGEAILRKLIEGRGFYPMAAAQKLNVNYPLTISIAKKPDAAIASIPEVQRVRELIYWQMDNLARIEWSYLVASQAKLKQQQLARYAFNQKWAALSVQATITGKMWDYLEERFPLAWLREFSHFTVNKGISQSYAMAIARQESAWNPQANSPVGAIGLMQVMPETAEDTVKKNGIQGYMNSSQLINPLTNIEIGTAYLESVYQRFGNNRILASAGYNAGPTRVDRWLSDSGGRLDAIAFIESIPFSETRNYVKSVLVYDVFYSHFMGKASNVLTNAEWQRRY